MISLDQIAQWLDPWNHLFAHSKMVAGTVTGAHIISLMFGGLAIAADRTTLRVDRFDSAARATQLREVRAVHAPVIAALVVLLVSGVLLAASDVETFLPSIWFWLKITLVVLLLINGGVLTAAERKLGAELTDAGWSRLRTLAWTSITLWTATAVVGIVLSNIS
ncbi:MAG: hypothetical protein ACHQWU_00725 [Gemmatimonadales bacterium]